MTYGISGVWETLRRTVSDSVPDSAQPQRRVRREPHSQDEVWCKDYVGSEASVQGSRFDPGLMPSTKTPALKWSSDAGTTPTQRTEGVTSVTDIKDIATLPAFPKGIDTDYGGLSIRDYFAAQAVMGLCAHQQSWDEEFEDIAIYAYGLADAMLRERAK